MTSRRTRSAAAARRCAALLALIAGWAGVTTAPAAAQDGDVRVRVIPATTEVVTIGLGTPPACGSWMFATFADVPGATSYTLKYTDNGREVVRRVGPSFGNRVVSGGQVVREAPEGTHQVGLTRYSSSGGGCPPPSWAGRFSNLHVEVGIPKDQRRITGTVRLRDCSTSDGSCRGPNGFPGATVTARGRGSSASAVTDSSGRFELYVEEGVYSVSARAEDLDFFPRSQRVTVRDRDRGGVDFDACRSNPDAEEDGCAGLKVTISSSTSPVRVRQRVAGPVPERVKFKVTVANTGSSPVRNVRLQEKLLVAFRGPARHTALPLRPECRTVRTRRGSRRRECGPDPANLGTIRAGGRKSGTYTYEARGDARLKVTALAVGSRDGRNVRGTGFTNLDIESPALVMSAELGARVRSPDARSLIKAGTAFAVRATLENRSYERRLRVLAWPLVPRGNARGGYWQATGSRIQDRVFASEQLTDDALPPVIELEPKQKREFNVVYVADFSDPRRKGGRARGGTRARLELVEPWVYEVRDDGSISDRLSQRETVVDDRGRRFTVGIDDRAAYRTPFSRSVAFAYFAKGAFEGAAHWGGTLLHGIFVDLPTMIGQGLATLPSGVAKFTQAQVELYQAAKQDPVAREQWLGATRQLLAANLEKLGQNAADVYAKVDAAVLASYEEMSNEWYAGDWVAASEAIGEEVAKRSLDVGTALGPLAARYAIPRVPRVQQALAATKQAVQARVAAATAAIGPGTRAGQAVGAIRGALQPGFEFSDALMRRLYGLRQVELDWLREFARRNRVLITIRSRAYEAVRWIDEFGAFLKPEQFKIKSVNWVDAEYLGYSAGDVGRLIVKRPIKRSTVQRRLRNEGYRPGDKHYETVMKRYEQRVFEYSTDEAGYVKSLRRYDRDGQVDFDFNWRDNLMDPSAAPLTPPQRAGFQLRARSGRQGEWEVLVDADRTGTFAPVAGDVDIVAITDELGTALTDAQHVDVLQQLRRGPLRTPHPETATWRKNGRFDFADKRKYLQDRECCALQIGPDGVGRAVMYDHRFSVLRNPEHYWLYFEGGYTLP